MPGPTPIDSEPRTGARRAPSLEAAIVAQRYFIDGKQKSELAQELGISRFKVARLLEEAKEGGIVHISVDLPTEIDLPLGDKLAARFGLSRAIVVHTLPAATATTPSLIGTAAANYLTQRITAQDALGISWGTSLSHVVEAVVSLEPCTIVQLVGGMHSADLNINGVELMRRLAAKGHGETYPLHVPLLLGSAATARELRADPGVASTLSQYPELTIALVGIGSWASGESSLYRELAPEERDSLTAQGAAADLCAIVLDGRGTPIDSPLLERTMGITAAELRSVPTVVAVAGGPNKIEAIRAALKSSLIDVLVTDDVTAAALLRQPDETA